MTNHRTTDVLLHAISDGLDLAPWIDGNESVLNDPKTDEAIRDALSGPVDANLSFGVPLLRWAGEDVPAMPLVQAVAFGHNFRLPNCSRCGVGLRGMRVSRLWVPMGASVVEVQVDGHCRGILIDQFLTLTWE